VSWCTYLDMDGTLVDLVGGVLRLYDVDPALADQVFGWDGIHKVVNAHNPHGYRVTNATMWATVDHAGPGFWADLKPYPWAADLYSLCAGAGPVVAMTTVIGPHAAAGKMAWIAKHLPARTRFALVGEEGAPVGEGAKHLLARPTAILVDDAPHYCHDFQSSGGLAFQWPAPWNGGCVSHLTHEMASQAALLQLKSLLDGRFSQTG
jgi:hypothetical protein